jgi:hypothetical protein
VPPWVPPEFQALVEDVKQGSRRTATVRDLVRWFGFERRGSKVNDYILGAMRAHGVTCTPAFDLVFADDRLTFSPLFPPSTPAPPPPAPAPPPPPAAPRDAAAPIAELARLVSTQTNTARRVNTRIDLVERIVVYLTTAMLCALREEDGGEHEGAVRKLLAPFLPGDERPAQPLSFGNWVSLARGLASASGGSTHPVLRAGAACGAGKSGPLVAVEREVVPLRNRFRHGTNLPEAAYREVEPLLETLTEALQQAARPLLDLDLVCLEDLEALSKDTFLHHLRVLQGHGSSFEVREVTLNEALRKGWAYLLVPGRPALRLAPGVWCEIDQATEEITVFLCRSLALEEGHTLSVTSLRGQHQKKITLTR